MARTEEILEYLKRLKEQAVDYGYSALSPDKRRDLWYQAKYGKEGYQSRLGTYEEEGVGDLPLQSSTYTQDAGWETKFPFYEHISRADPIAAGNLEEPRDTDPPQALRLEEPTPRRRKKKR